MPSQPFPKVKAINQGMISETGAFKYKRIRFRVKGKSRGKQHFSGLTLTSQLDRVEAWPVELRNSTGWSSRWSSWSSRWLLLLPLRIQLSCVHAKSLHAPRPICSRMLQKTYFKGPNMHMYANAT
ncbi:unnamed protein product [Microthlaspi erraticum]|uniref:Uncharacterized protein n=1 Tax=Microthlaspi erraticum TaxID=1685480 RepID=A0A6D2JL94_9BRAS|nr:unnamed protein product [Microthlaspi erraticum]